MSSGFRFCFEFASGKSLWCSLMFDSEAMYNVYNAGSENPWLDRVNVQEHKLPGFLQNVFASGMSCDTCAAR